MAKRILRMENEKGEGPYKDKHAYSRWHGEAMVSGEPDIEGRTDQVGKPLARHPGPDTDIGPHAPKLLKAGHRFAFGDQHQAHAWFNEQEREILKKRGYDLRAYDVPDEDVVPGKKQVLFKPDRAVKR